jgi:hypothetical protein
VSKHKAAWALDPGTKVESACYGSQVVESVDQVREEIVRLNYASGLWDFWPRNSLIQILD